MTSEAELKLLNEMAEADKLRKQAAREVDTGHAQFVKRDRAWVLQHQWIVTEWMDGIWVPRREWRDVPMVEE